MRPLFVLAFPLALLWLAVSAADATDPVVEMDVAQCRVSARINASLSAPAGASREPTLLFWDTSGVNYEMYGMWFGPSAYYQCPVQCRVETTRSAEAAQSAEAVLFWATPIGKGFDFEDKCPGQVWLQASTEAFDIRILDRTPPGEGALMLDGRPSPIDVEVSWRRQLGPERVSWLNNFDWNSGRAMEALWDAPVDAPLHPSTRTRSGREPGQAAVAAFISNCGAESARLELMQLLQKYIAVDSFGRCAHSKEIPAHWVEESDTSRGFLTQKNLILSRRYKFLLSFENQRTDDYVTEKFFHPFAWANVLPIVLGAPNIREYAPEPADWAGEPSFLNIDDFGWRDDGTTEEKERAAQALAARVDELDRDDEAYLRHFAWRRAHKFGPLFSEAMAYSWLYSPCQVCQTIHQKLYGTEPVPLVSDVWDAPREPTPPRKVPEEIWHEEL
jgi:hypothetical protein